MELKISSLDELAFTANKLLNYAKGKKKMTFTGEIGAGKTTFIQSFCKLLGVKDKVKSPTFSLINEYSFIDPNTREERLIHHLDLYRLKNIEEAIDIGLEDYLYDDDYCLIEWPEIISLLLPEERIEIKIEILEDSSRNIIFL